MKPAPHYANYKALFVHKEVIIDVARGYLHEELLGGVDWDSLELVPLEGAARESPPVTDDFARRMRTKPSDSRWEQWIYMYVMLVLASPPDPYMAARTLSKLGAFYEHLIAQQNSREVSKLPEVLPVVIYSGPWEWNAPYLVDELVRRSMLGFEPYRLALRCKILDTRRCGEARTELNLAEVAFRLEGSEIWEQVEWGISQLAGRFKGGQLHEVDRSFVEWLKVLMRDRYHHEKIPECSTVEGLWAGLLDESPRWSLRQIVKQAEAAGKKAAAKAFAEDFAKGRAEGRAQVLHEYVLLWRKSLASHASDRFGEQTARVLRAELEFVEEPGDMDRIMDWIETCDNGDALLTLVRTL